MKTTAACLGELACSLQLRLSCTVGLLQRRSATERAGQLLANVAYGILHCLRACATATNQAAPRHLQHENSMHRLLWGEKACLIVWSQHRGL